MSMSKKQVDALTRLTRAYTDAVAKFFGEQARAVVALDPDPANSATGVMVLHNQMEVDETISVLTYGLYTMYTVNQQMIEANQSTKH